MCASLNVRKLQCAQLRCAQIRCAQMTNAQIQCAQKNIARYFLTFIEVFSNILCSFVFLLNMVADVDTPPTDSLTPLGQCGKITNLKTQTLLHIGLIMRH